MSETSRPTTPVAGMDFPEEEGVPMHTAIEVAPPIEPPREAPVVEGAREGSASTHTPPRIPALGMHTGPRIPEPEEEDETAFFHDRGGLRVDHTRVSREYADTATFRTPPAQRSELTDLEVENARRILERLVNSRDPRANIINPAPLERFDRRATLGPPGTIRRNRYSIAPRTAAYSDRTGNKAKLKVPPIFKGTYSEMNNVLNWIITTERYLYNCDVVGELYPTYAYTYLGETVQAWYDNKFLSDPTPRWEDVTDALKHRYLPRDHIPRLLRKFQQTRQLRSLMDYVDNFQIVVSAMELAGIVKSQEELIRQFIDGLKLFEDRVNMLTHKMKTINDCYELATLIRGARAVAGTDSSDRSSGKKLHRLTGQEKKIAFQKDLCLACGEAGHYWRACPKDKKIIKFLQKRNGPKKPTASSRVAPKKNFMMATEAEEDSEEEESEEEESSSSEEESDEGNVSPRSEEGEGREGL